jgi:hypothetical protein
VVDGFHHNRHVESEIATMREDRDQEDIAEAMVEQDAEVLAEQRAEEMAEQPEEEFGEELEDELADWREEAWAERQTDQSLNQNP